MKCLICNVWTLVKRTDGAMRRRECANGHRFTTEEVPSSELNMEAYRLRTEAARKVLREKGYLV